VGVTDFGRRPYWPNAYHYRKVSKRLNARLRLLHGTSINFLVERCPYMVQAMITNHGCITLELLPDKAPETVRENFKQYGAVDAIYDNTSTSTASFPNFMSEGRGGFEPGMKAAKGSAARQSKNVSQQCVANADGHRRHRPHHGAALR